MGYYSFILSSRVSYVENLCVTVQFTCNRPLWAAFRLWCESQLVRIPAKGDLVKAMRYALSSGRPHCHRQQSRRARHPPVAIGRKNWLFAGSDAGGETLADAMTIIETAKLSGLRA